MEKKNRKSQPQIDDSEASMMMMSTVTNSVLGILTAIGNIGIFSNSQIFTGNLTGKSRGNYNI